MNESWSKKPSTDWSLSAALKSLEDLGDQFKRNVDLRMRKGDVRSAILRLLAESPMHGYQIIHEIEARSNGVWKPSAGSVYPTLQLLSDEGLIEANDSDGRRTYSLTLAGREIANAESENTAPWLAGLDRPAGPRGTLALSGVKLAKAAADVARAGSTEQIEQASLLIEQTSKKLSALLAQD